MSPKKDETAVPALSVLFLLVSCKVNITRSNVFVILVDSTFRTRPIDSPSNPA